MNYYLTLLKIYCLPHRSPQVHVLWNFRLYVERTLIIEVFFRLGKILVIT
jgi:hypothetical protein